MLCCCWISQKETEKQRFYAIMIQSDLVRFRLNLESLILVHPLSFISRLLYPSWYFINNLKIEIKHVFWYALFKATISQGEWFCKYIMRHWVFLNVSHDSFTEVAPSRRTIVSTKFPAAKSLHSCPTLCDSIDSSLPGSSIHGIFLARVLEWVAIAFSIY